MKKIIGLSLILNLGLVGVIAYGFKVRRESVALPGQTAEVTEEIPQTKTSESIKAISGIGSPVTNRVRATDDSGFSWRKIESPDYKAYIANLRGVGCPEETIVDIILADIGKYYRNKLAPLKKDNDPTYKYWQGDNNWWRRNPEYEKAAQEAYREQRKLFKELLGKEYWKELSKQNGWGTGDEDPFQKSLTDEKKDRMQEIGEKYGELEQEIHRKARGWTDEDDQAELSKIRKQKEAELAKVLTPDEFFEYQLRNSQTVQNMKWSELEGFDVTEQEFRAMAKVKLAAEDQSEINPETGQKFTREERSKLEKKLEEDLKTTLGEERYKEYKLSSEWEYRNLVGITKKLNLGKEVASQVYGMKDDIEKAARMVRADKSLTPQERDEKLLAIKSETEKTLNEALGERGARAFKRNAWWLRNIVPEKRNP